MVLRLMAYSPRRRIRLVLEVIANNATGMSSALARGAARKGELLLPGLLRCGHCGRKLHAHYSGKIGRYNCYGSRTNHGAARCISISGLSIDAAISSEVLRVLKPLGIEAALKAIEAQSSTTGAAERQLELSLQQARCEAAHARRQYDAVDPANRLVAGELKRRWNEALQAIAKLEGEIAALIARRVAALGEPERQQLAALGADLDRAWLHRVQPPQRASVSFARHSRRSSCARTAQSSMRSCTGKAATISNCKSNSD